MLECAVALVLLTDISGSMTDKNYEHQQHGIADTMQDEKFLDIIAARPGGVAVSVIQFGDDAVLSVPWVILNTQDDAIKLSQTIRNAPRVASPHGTGIGTAIVAGLEYFNELPCKAQGKVMDVSGDGVNNTEYPVHSARNEAIAQGVMVNGLAIQAGEPGIAQHFAEDVMTPDGFVIEAWSWADFARAIRRKIIREIS